MKVLLKFPLGLFLFLLFNVSCKSSLEFKAATRQSFAGGAAGSGPGNHYNVLLEKPGKGSLKVEGVWMGDRQKGKLFRINIQPEGSNQIIGKGNVPDSVKSFFIRFSEQFEGEGNPNLKEKDSPFESQPAVVAAPDWLPKSFIKGCIIYIADGSKKIFLEVKDFKDLPPLILP